jgi:plastocyanin
MNGRIVVQETGATATNTPAPTNTPVPPTNTPAPTSTPIPLTTVVAHVSLPLVAKTGGVGSGEVAVYQGTFYPKTITVKAGTTVHWVDQATSHTVTSDATKPDGTRLFNSDTVYPDGIKPGQEYAVTFSEPGTYAYFCEFHGAPGGVGHAGTVVVTS